MSFKRVNDCFLPKSRIVRIKVEQVSIGTYMLDTQSIYNNHDNSPFHDYKIQYHDIESLISSVDQILDINSSCYMDDKTSQLITKLKTNKE